MSITNEGVFINNESLYSLPVGTIVIWLNETLPNTNFLYCDGNSYSPTYYPDLYTVIQNSYGGSTTSPKLPDFTGRLPMGGDVTTAGSTMIPNDEITLSPMPYTSNATLKTGGNSTMHASQLIHTHKVYGNQNYVTAIYNTTNTDWNDDAENYYNVGGSYNVTDKILGTQDIVDAAADNQGSNTAATTAAAAEALQNQSSHRPPHKFVNYIIYVGYNATPGAVNEL